MRELALFVLFSCLCFIVQAKTSITVGVQEGLLKGYGMTLLKEIFEPLDMEVVQSQATWAQAISMVEVGDIDCIVGVHPIEFPDFVFPEESIGVRYYEVFKRADDPWVYLGLESFKGRKIGADSQVAYDNAAIDAYLAGGSGNASVQWSKGVDMQALLSKRVDVVIADPFVLKQELLQRSLVGFVRSAGRLTGLKQEYFACSAAREAGEVFVRLFDTRLRALRQAGRVDQVMQQYGLEDWANIR